MTRTYEMEPLLCLLTENINFKRFFVPQTNSCFSKHLLLDTDVKVFKEIILSGWVG